MVTSLSLTIERRFSAFASAVNSWSLATTSTSETNSLVATNAPTPAAQTDIPDNSTSSSSRTPHNRPTTNRCPKVAPLFVESSPTATFPTAAVVPRSNSGD
ncbi:hypothetical protein MLD38_006556 [Melastoma candidum]|uniref:Uncharacterized protein n=1 Tax=Melastoma candidum TaxID=119954 RepID=A0ACB9RPH8_9MYRT|nr:hypothetical protein MLD38_006556 [Melastoma candidum]